MNMLLDIAIILLNIALIIHIYNHNKVINGIIEDLKTLESQFTFLKERTEEYKDIKKY